MAEQGDQRLHGAAERLRAIRHEAFLQTCRDDYGIFKRYVLEADDGGPLYAEPYSDAWTEHIDRWIGTHHVGIIAPPGTGKTFTEGIGRCLWWLGRDHNERIAFVSAKESTAKKSLNAVMQYIEEGKRLHEVFPDLVKGTWPGAAWNSEQLFVERTLFTGHPSVSAFSMDAKESGIRCTKIIMDDPIDKDDMVSPTKRSQHILVYKKVWRLRLTREPPGRIVLLVMFRWHDEDLVSELLRNPRYRILIQGVSDDCTQLEQPPRHILTGGPLAALADGAINIFPKPQLLPSIAELRSDKEYDPVDFGHSFQQRSLASFDKTFSDLGLNTVLRWDLDVSRLCEQAFQAYWPTFVTTDFSKKSDPARDRKERRKGSVIMVGARMPDGRKCLLSVDVGSWGAGAEMAGRMKAAYDRFRSCSMWVEDAGLQSEFVEWFREFFKGGGYNLSALGGVHKKMDPALGVPSVDAEFRRGEWVIPVAQVAEYRDRFHRNETNAWCRLLTELKNHPSASDDCIMALWQMQQVLKDPQNNSKVAPGWLSRQLDDVPRPGSRRHFAPTAGQPRVSVLSPSGMEASGRRFF